MARPSSTPFPGPSSPLALAAQLLGVDAQRLPTARVTGAELGGILKTGRIGLPRPRRSKVGGLLSCTQTIMDPNPSGGVWGFSPIPSPRSPKTILGTTQVKEVPFRITWSDRFKNLGLPGYRVSKTTRQRPRTPRTELQDRKSELSPKTEVCGCGDLLVNPV